MNRFFFLVQLPHNCREYCLLLTYDVTKTNYEPLNLLSHCKCPLLFVQAVYIFFSCVLFPSNRSFMCCRCETNISSGVSFINLLFAVHFFLFHLLGSFDFVSFCYDAHKPLLCKCFISFVFYFFFVSVEKKTINAINAP